MLRPNRLRALIATAAPVLTASALTLVLAGCSGGSTPTSPVDPLATAANGNDDGTADQGPGDNGTTTTTTTNGGGTGVGNGNDDGTQDQGPGDFGATGGTTGGGNGNDDGTADQGGGNDDDPPGDDHGNHGGNNDDPPGDDHGNHGNGHG